MPINKLDTTGSWAINGTPIYIPSAGVGYTHTNVAGSSSGRTQDGIQHIDWVRRDLRKVTINYSAMTGQELNFLIGLVQGQEYTATFKDRGQVQTMSAYTGDCDYTLHSEALYESEGGLYTDVSFDMVEM